MSQGNDVSAYLQGFRDALGNVPEQRQSRLMPGVMAHLNYSEPGTSFNLDDVEEAGGPQVPQGKMGFLSPREIGQGRRAGYFSPIEDWFNVDVYDKVRLACDPTSAKMVAMTSKKEKQKDIYILDALFGTTYETDDSGNPVTPKALPAAQVIAANDRQNLHDAEAKIVAASGDLGLTVGKLITAKMMLNKGEVDGSEDYIALNSEALGHLLASTAGTSADYNQVKALIDGAINTFMGFKVLRYEGLTVAGGIVDIPVWRKGAVHYAERDLQVLKITERNDLSGHPWQCYYKTEHAKLRRYDKGVVKIRAASVRALA